MPVRLGLEKRKPLPPSARKKPDTPTKTEKKGPGEIFFWRPSPSAEKKGEFPQPAVGKLHRNQRRAKSSQRIQRRGCGRCLPAVALAEEGRSDLIVRRSA